MRVPTSPDSTRITGALQNQMKPTSADKEKEWIQAEMITVAVQELHLGNQGTNGEQSELDFFTL